MMGDRPRHQAISIFPFCSFEIRLLDVVWLLPALTAGFVGVSSERSGDDSVCASALAVVWNRPRAGSSEDSASRMGGESRGPETWTIA